MVDFVFPLAVFRRITPQINAARTLEFYQALITNWPKYGIISEEDQVVFLAQTLYESNGFTKLEENLNYSAERLCQLFPQHFFDLIDAQTYVAQPEKLANIIYGKRFGNVTEDDGWRYRGRGLLQTTFRANYLKLADQLNLLLDDKLLEYVATPEGAVAAAGVFWQTHKLTGMDMTHVTSIISGQLTTAYPRMVLYLEIKQLLAAHSDPTVEV